MIDRAKLDQMLSNLEGYLEVLRGISRVPRREFLDDFARAVGTMGA